MSLLFNTQSSLVIVLLPRSKHLLISWLQLLSAVIMEPKKIKSVTVSIVSSYIYYQVMGPHVMILGFWMLSFRPAFSLSLSSRGSLVPLLFLVVSSTYVRLLIFLQAILIPAYSSFHPAFCMMYFAYKLNKQGDTALTCSFPNFEPVHSSMSNCNCCFLTCIQISQEAGKAVCYSLSLTFFPFFLLFLCSNSQRL